MKRTRKQLDAARDRFDMLMAKTRDAVDRLEYGFEDLWLELDERLIETELRAKAARTPAKGAGK